MPVHDWTRVEAGTFHDFHTRWITHLTEVLNGGLLPWGYYATTERWAGQAVEDLLALRAARPAKETEGGVAVIEPPRTGGKPALSPVARGTRHAMAIRHASGHRVVAVMETVSPADKGRKAHVAEFIAKAQAALALGIHVLLVDLIPPGPHDPQGMHAALWRRLGNKAYRLPPDRPLTLASYIAGPPLQAHLEHLAVGSPLAEMPLFLDVDGYVSLPLERTYAASYQRMPPYWRSVLEGDQPRR